MKNSHNIYFNMTGKIFCILLLTSISVIPASDFALYGSFISGGATSGGLRYSLSDDICFDLSLGSSINTGSGGFGSNTDLYFDVFFLGQTLGVVFAANIPDGGSTSLTAGIAYALEKSINDNVALGVAPTLISKEFREGSQSDIEILSGWTVYTVIGF
jgi:hypothetical protein